MAVWRGVIYQGNDLSRWYEVSDGGELRNASTKHVVKQQKAKSGYLLYCGSLGSRKRKITLRVHKAVAESFIDNPNRYPAVNHKDGNKENNKAENLEWVTNKQNTDHAIKHGLFSFLPPGPLHPNAKLSTADVKTIRTLSREGAKTRQLAKQFGIDHSTITRITNPNSTRPLYQSVI